MKEIEIKRYLVQGLLPLNNGAVISSEFRYLFGSRRADLAILDDSIATAFEIKGAQDSPERLVEQIAAYKKYFDYCYVVCEKTNIKAVRSFTHLSVGIVLVKDNGDIHFVRKAKKNKRLDKIALTSTLSTAELRRNFKCTFGKSKFEICQHISSHYPLSQIKEYSRKSMFEKYFSSTNLFKKDIKKTVNSDDIKTISISSPDKIQIP